MFLLESIKDLDKSNRWSPKFQMLQLETRTVVESKTQKVASFSCNRSLNRYRDVLPYDQSRVCLQDGDNDYINADLVQVPGIERSYILTQGPLRSTCVSFWQMVWENECKAIIMLNRIVEKNMVKCHPYWPLGENEIVEFGDFQVSNNSEQHHKAYIVRELQITNTLNSEQRTIQHFHFLIWPDFGVPATPWTFLSFLKHINASDVFSFPPIVHCSAGIGRSGTFCLVDAALKMAKDSNSPDGIDPDAMLLSLRKYRCGLIQTHEQYRFALLSIACGFKELFPELFKTEEEQQLLLSNGNVGDQEDAVYKDQQQMQQYIKFFDLESSFSDSDSEEVLLDLSDISDDSEELFESLRTTVEEDTTVDEEDRSKGKHAATYGETVEKQDANKTNEDKQDNVSSQSIDKASVERESALRQRLLRNQKTKKLIEEIKVKMKKSEKSNKKVYYVLTGAVVVSSVLLAYWWFS